MKEQYVNLEIVTDGMFPIHQAVCNNDEFLLKQHIFLWTKFKQVDLNSLYTDEDEDLLQLAIIHNSFPEIVQILLDNNLDVQDLRDNSNTVIHLAIINQINIQSFILLMEKIDLQLLSKLNDDGLSPLHLSLRSNQFSYAEVMLNTVDKRLMGCVKYCRISDSKEVDPIDYYISMCEQIDEKYIQESLKHSAKTKLLNVREMMTGNTALFHAVGKNTENFIYFLLAHGSNPSVQNYSGQDPRSFLGDHGKLLSISLKVDRTMEKLSKVIRKYDK
ncbi:uncharacterized protein LOC119689389 [Teleopsis dalmanni]|uniref:uncharacterized protein LOC119689389 n=1 Tax=Teleopsis dalmanni TaxID=139649 RepID=UPI0018CE92A8|nr:uncharacterized protein LOC119689389 [Teleopsis dalmanni]